MAKITVLITSFNDKRISLTLESLQKQTKRPDEILVADGGSDEEIREICGKFPVWFEILPGNVVETRSKAIKLIGEGIVAFIDTDEVAPETWLRDLVAPIEEGKADFTGGPTRHYPPRSGPERYLNEIEDYIYGTLVPQNIAYLPMGNSAWKKEIFDKVGGFDLTIAGGGEDYDINLKAGRLGYRGLLVGSAYLYHDQSGVNSYWKLVRKRYSYLRATAKTYIKNRSLSSGISRSSKGRIAHPFFIVETLLKPVALVDAILRS
ncbi:MAG: glycosyltransferase family 2 protein [Thermoplasmata archaeon]